MASLLILQQICSLYSMQVYTACKAKKKSNTIDRLLSQQIWPNSMLTIFFLKNRNGTWDMLIVTTEWKYIPNRSVRKLTVPNNPQNSWISIFNFQLYTNKFRTNYQIKYLWEEWSTQFWSSIPSFSNIILLNPNY